MTPRINFVLVGGYAAILHRSRLRTRELADRATLTPDTIEKLREVFRAFNPRHRLAAPQSSFLDDPEPGVALNSLYLNTDLGTLNLISSITGIGDYARVARDSVEIELLGRRIRAISLDDLINAKEARGRHSFRAMVVAKTQRFAGTAQHISCGNPLLERVK